MKDQLINDVLEVLNYANVYDLTEEDASLALGKKKTYSTNARKAIEKKYHAREISRVDFNRINDTYAAYEENINNKNTNNIPEYNINEYTPDMNEPAISNEGNQNENIRNLILQNPNLKSQEIVARWFLPVTWQVVAGIKAGMAKNANTTRPTPRTASKKVDLNDLTPEELTVQNYDAETDKNYDTKKSFGKRLRDKNKKIIGYHYNIVMTGKKPLNGQFTLQEMETIYNLYSSYEGANLDMREVSRRFRHINPMDFKRIARAFNITKASIPMAPHNIENLTEDEQIDLTFQNKEFNYFRKLETEKPKKLELAWENLMKENFELKQSKTFMKEILESISLDNIKPFKIDKKVINDERALFVYLSDAHIGADTLKDSIYANPYDGAEFNKRLEIVLAKIKEQHKTFGRFDKVVIFNMGDCLDGLNAQTTRGGHSLPQNLNNKEQSNTYITSMRRFFASLHKMNIANAIEFISTGNDNHSGDVGYMANKSLELYCSAKYPDMKVRVFEKFIETVEYGKHSFIITHGKDEINMKHGLPLYLNNKTELFINGYISYNKIVSPFIHLIKGDLHQTNSIQCRTFRYKNVSSIYGSSDWIHVNFGYTRPAVDFEIVSKNSGLVLEGTIAVTDAK